MTYRDTAILKIKKKNMKDLHKVLKSELIRPLLSFEVEPHIMKKLCLYYVSLHILNKKDI